jgi:glycosyltransferase involved in cell wall biosynthesis
MKPPWTIPKIDQSRGPADREFRATAIVSTYQSAQFIRGCLEDLVSQTLFAASDLEILVIDSGSPENEGDVVREFQRQHSNIIYTRTDREPLYTAWNRAIGTARGEYVTNANTDDRHRADAVEIMARALDQHPEVAIVYGDNLETTEPNATFATVKETRLMRRADYSLAGLLGEDRCGPQPMWRKKLHHELGGFCEEFKVASDYEWWLRVAGKYPLLHIPETIGLYLRRPDSIENRQLKVCAAETERIQQFYEKEYAVDPKLIRRKPKAAIPKFFWRMKRSIKKRLSSSANQR